jgi:Cytochrome P450
MGVSASRPALGFESSYLWKLYILLPALLISYLVGLALYRLYFSPLASFPGPKLAALSNWYEFYWDVIQQGQFTSHIQKLHLQYGKSLLSSIHRPESIFEIITGPIIRITPTELHIDDPEYYETLYSRAGPRDKYSYFSGRFGYASDCFSTINHDLHRLRRKALSPMFSVKKIEEFQPVIKEKVEKLCRKFALYNQDGQVVPLGRAWMALTTDVITEYSFAKSYDQLDSPNFQETLHEALVAIYTTGQFALHFPIVFPILDILPEWLVKMAQPEVLPVVGLRKVNSLHFFASPVLLRIY